MKRLALALALGLFAFAVQAQADVAPAAAESPADENVVITSDKVAEESTGDKRCIRETGTRLKSRDANGCTGAPGQSYSREDLERSGGTSTADMLERLDPSLRVRNGG